jgi:hypothetical protein
MSRVWWGRETLETSAPKSLHPLVDGDLNKRPQLHSGSSKQVQREAMDRRNTFTDEWDTLEFDAGKALVELFSLQTAPLLNRLNRLPDKAFVEFLRTAGVRPTPARPAVSMVQFTVSQAAETSVAIPKGFQLSAAPASGEGDTVTFETQHDAFVTSATIKKILYVHRGRKKDVTADNEISTGAFEPFGSEPEVGDVLLIGLDPAAAITQDISFGIRIAAAPGKPPPVSAGGVAPLPLPVSPTLSWEARVAGNFEPVEVLRDETSNLWQSGIVQFKVPRPWEPDDYLEEGSHYWIRLSLVYGGFDEAPQVSFVQANMVRVNAVRTIRDEVVEKAGQSGTGSMFLKNTPIVPRSLVISVDATPLSDGDETSGDAIQWQETDDLSQHDKDDRVFTLDSATGEIAVGDGIHGAPFPPGFRNVRADSYEVGGGINGAVDADEIKTMLNSAPFVMGVTNPLPASGGVDEEANLDAVVRGPEVIRARKRAVTVADYALMARSAPGADVRKAVALSGYHPLFPRLPIPGVVGVAVVPKESDAGPPIPNEETLRSVSKYLSEQVAPADVEVVACAPTYRRIRTEVGFVARPSADSGEIIRDTIAKLNGYLHPLAGGEDGRGWPFEGTLYYSKLMRHLLEISPDILAIPRLRIFVDGVPQERCADVSLKPLHLFWPEGHQVFPMSGEDSI